MGNKPKTQENGKNTYTKDMLVRKISDVCGRDMSTIRTVYNTLEEIVANLLSSAKPNTDVSIRLFEGITLDSTYIPEKTKLNNLTGKVITTTSKIKPKANITRTYCNKLTHNK